MPKYYIESGNVSFVVCANDAEGAALWAMHRTIDDKICEYEDELSLRSHLIEDAAAYEEPIDGVPENVPFEPMLEGLAEFDEKIVVSERITDRCQFGRVKNISNGYHQHSLAQYRNCC